MTERETILFRDDAEARGYTCLPNAVLDSPNLSAPAKVVYGLLRFYAGQDERFFHGMEALAAQVPCSLRSLRAYLTELEAHLLVSPERRGRGLVNRLVLEPLTEDALASLTDLTRSDE
jgi:hypothetical protein